MSKKSQSIMDGVTMGSALAMIISWDRTHSLVWVLLHGMCSWLYVLWFAVWGGK